MQVKKYHVAAVIGTTENGEAYSYELGAAVASAKNRTDPADFFTKLDRFEQDARDRLVLHFERKETGDLVISSIIRDGTLLMEEIDEAAKNGASAKEIDEMKTRAKFPDRAQIHGVLFEKGGAARGTVVDEKLFEAALPAFDVCGYVEREIDRQDQLDSQPLMSAFRTAAKEIRQTRSAGSGPVSAPTVDLSSFKADDPFHKKGFEATSEPQDL